MFLKKKSKDFRVAVGADPADRAIPPLRADLRISPQLFYGQLCFVVKDPVTLRYFRMQPIEHFLITQLDGKRTARDLLGLLHQQHPDSPLDVQEILRFVGMLHESHLLEGEGIAHAQWLGQRAKTNRRRRIWQFSQNFLFLKIPLYNPDRLLTIMEEAFGRLIFSPMTGLIAVLLCVVALAGVLGQTDRFWSLPYSLLSWQNLLLLYAVFIVTKVFHEFGHGLACKHFGGEVTNMGVMVFVMTPSFYCDTSDAWMIPSRAARLWINAAGIVVELVLAALAALVWMATQSDTLVNQIALNVMITCSAATLVFNLNPLLRYDGYYFLSDLLELPNLMTKSQQLLRCYAQKHLLGLKPTMPLDARRVPTLLTFAVLSGAYRWLVVFGIVVLVYYFFDEHGMTPIGTAIAGAYLIGSVVVPLVKAVRFIWKQRFEIRRRLAYLGAVSGAGVAALVLVALLPWSMTIRQPMVVLSEQDVPIFVRSPGFVQAVEADAGQAVRQGQVIVQLHDPELQTLLDKATARRDQEQINVTNARANANPAAVAAAQTAVDAYNRQIELLRQRLAELTIRAPIDGVVIRETPLRRIAGNYLPPGTRLCRVIRADKLQARISLPQQQAAMVADGMPVRIRLWTQPANVIQAKVTRVSSTVSDQLLHPALASTVKGDVEVTQDASGNIKSLSRRTTVVIDLPTNQGFFADGMTGRAEITVQRTTVIGRVWRAVLDSVHPDWQL